MKTVFLSSTSKDLELYRKAAVEVCLRLGLHPIAMEYFNAQSAGATAGSKRELDKANLYVGFYAHRYGYIEDPADGRSVTEIEFDYAKEKHLDQICFIIDPKHPFPEEAMDHENNAKLVAFKNKVNKLIRGQFTSVDNFTSLLTTALVEWMGGQTECASTTVSSAIFATRPDHLREKPRVFIGREDLFNQAYALLEAHQPVLLQGFGGMGKTALAAALAARWIDNHKAGSKNGALWLKAGSAGVDALFETLARPFNQEKAIASQTGDAKITAVNDLLYGSGASLLVLDDCWSGPDLAALLDVVPDDLPVLITARQRYPIDGDILHVDELSDTDALALLNQHARNLSNAVGTRHAVSGEGQPTVMTEKRDVTPSSLAGRVGVGSALDLCHLLGNHAFAIEIAGKTLKAQQQTPAELIQQIKNAPYELEVPLELSEAGRENVAKLLEVSLNALDEAARSTFLAFGAFFAPQLTPEMLMRYFVGKREVSDDLVQEFRRQNPQFDNLSYDEIRTGLEQALNAEVHPEPAQKALDTLHLHGLVERLPATDSSIASYRVHDLAYCYARAQATDDQHQRALQTCISYTEHYNQPSLPNFAALRPELDNFLSAADWAFEHKRLAEVEQFARNLYEGSNAGGGFLHYQGFSSQSTHLLIQAAQAAERAGNRYNQAAHLGNLGLAYRNLGQVATAIDYHQQAITIQREIGDKRGQGYSLGNLGNAYSDLGQVEKAIEYHQQDLTIAREIGDKRGEGAVLGNLGNAYADLGQVETAIDYYQQALAIDREISDKRGEGQDLGNLGLAYRALGQVKQAIDYYQRALSIIREIGDKHNEGDLRGNLGNAYCALGQVETAIDYYQQALAIQREIGDRMGQANQLGNLGNVYDDLKDYPRALDYYQQARAIFAEIGTQHLVAKTDRNIARTRSKMNAATPDTPDLST